MSCLRFVPTLSSCHRANAVTQSFEETHNVVVVVSSSRPGAKRQRAAGAVDKRLPAEEAH